MAFLLVGENGNSLLWPADRWEKRGNAIAYCWFGGKKCQMQIATCHWWEKVEWH